MVYGWMSSLSVGCRVQRWVGNPMRKRPVLNRHSSSLRVRLLTYRERPSCRLPTHMIPRVPNLLCVSSTRPASCSNSFRNAATAMALCASCGSFTHPPPCPPPAPTNHATHCSTKHIVQCMSPSRMVSELGHRGICDEASARKSTKPPRPFSKSGGTRRSGSMLCPLLCSWHGLLPPQEHWFRVSTHFASPCCTRLLLSKHNKCQQRSQVSRVPV